MKKIATLLGFVLAYFSAIGMTYVGCDLLCLSYRLSEIMLGSFIGCVIGVLLLVVAELIKRDGTEDNKK